MTSDTEKRIVLSIDTDAARRDLDRLCEALDIEPDKPRSKETRWQRAKAWLFDRPLRYPWLLRAETWVLEKLGKRPRACVLVARKLDAKIAAVRHEAEDLTARADTAVADDARYLGFCGQSTRAGALVEVRFDDGHRETMVVDDVGVDQVRVRDQVTGDLSTHMWWNVRRIRQHGDAPDVKVPAPGFNKDGDLVPALEPGQLELPPPPRNVHRHDGHDPDDIVRPYCGPHAEDTTDKLREKIREQADGRRRPAPNDGGANLHRDCEGNTDE